MTKYTKISFQSNDDEVLQIIIFTDGINSNDYFTTEFVVANHLFFTKWNLYKHG